MAYFFPLAQVCTIQTSTPTRDISGQYIEHWTTLATVNCLWYQTIGNREIRELIEYGVTAELYVDASVVIEEGNRIINITDADGSIREAGPFLVVMVRDVPTLGGLGHHKSIKLRGSE